MGILKNIFKSLGWGGEEENAKPTEPTKPAEPTKPIEPVPAPKPVPPPAYSKPISESKPATSLPKDPVGEKRSDPPRVETPIYKPPAPPAAKVPTPVSQPEVVRKPDVKPAYSAPAVVEQPQYTAPAIGFESRSERANAPVSSVAEIAREVSRGPAIVNTPVSIPSAPVSTSNELSFLDEFVDEFDDAFDAAFLAPGSVSMDQSIAPGEVQHDEAAIQDLFANIAANYARPVKNFVFELRRGTATKEWIEICRPALRSISRAAESMELTSAAKRMNDFDEALSLAQTSEDRILGGEIRELILSSYEDLIAVLPQTFIIGEEEQQREGIIINSLLKQIPDLGRVTFEKLYGAGLTSLDTLFLAKKEDLAAATGIPLWLCERICNKFQEYREELDGTPRDVAQSGYRTRLSELVSELRRQHEGFERASAQEWSNPALASDKRKFRQNRQACVLQINVVLAEMGELDLVNEIQKLSFERRIQRLEEYLQSSAGM